MENAAVLGMVWWILLCHGHADKEPVRCALPTALNRVNTVLNTIYYVSCLLYVISLPNLPPSHSWLGFEVKL